MESFDPAEVKSFCDPNGKDLDDYRRHQRMVQVRQDGEELAQAERKSNSSEMKQVSISRVEIQHGVFPISAKFD